MDVNGLMNVINSTDLNLPVEVGVAVLNKSLDAMDEQGQALIKMMEASVNPNLGQNLDIKV